MSRGLVKAKKYDWKDSNLALFGSDTEKQVKKESAESEPAWQGAGQEVGLKIWRIVKFEVTSWPEQDYGKFYCGDSYIILNTYHPEPESEELAYDVHFWIGAESTQDEYGTAAYKTVELDTFLDDKPVQHREVQGHESELYKSYFKTITIMKGGAATGFNHVTPEEYGKRLLHFCGTRKNINVTEVPLVRSRLNSGDVFILDLGLKVYQWNGSGSNKDERFKAAQYLNELKEERRGKASVEVVDESSDPSSHPFYGELDGEDEDDEDTPDVAGTPELFRVSDATGFMQFAKLKDGGITMKDFDSKDVFMLDTGAEFFVWIGTNASPTEKKNGFGYAHKQLAKTSHPWLPVVVVKEGQKNSAFMAAVSAAA